MTPEERAERIRSMFVIRSYSNGAGKTVERVDIEVHRIADEIREAVEEETMELEGRHYRKKSLIDALVAKILTVRHEAFEDAANIAKSLRDKLRDQSTFNDGMSQACRLIEKEIRERIEDNSR